MITQDPNNKTIYINYNRKIQKTVALRKNRIWDKKCAEIDKYKRGTRV